MHMTTIGRTMAAGCLLAMAACGSSGGSGGSSAEEKPYVTALQESMTESGEADGSGFSLNEKQASCMAPKWIRTIGVDRLKAKGISPADLGDDTESDADLTTLELSEAEGGSLYDAFGSCDVDIKSLFINSLKEDMSDEDKQCVDKNFSDDLLKKVLVAELIKGDEGLQNDSALTTEVQDALAKCPGAVAG